MSGRTHPLETVPGLRALALAQHGVVRRDQLAALDVTRHHVRRQVEAERWMVVGTRVVVLTRGALTREQGMRVALAHAGPRSALAAWTALEHAGLRGWERPGVHLLVPRGLHPSPLAGVTVRQSLHLEASDLVVGSMTRTTAARAAVDAAGLERTARSAAALVIAVAQQRLASAADMAEVLDRLGRVPRTAVLRRALADAADGAESLAESDVVALVRRAGLPEPRRQVVVETPDGPRRLDVVVDLPDGRTLVIEVDGVQHGDPRARARDAATDAALIASGHLVLRLPVHAVRTDRAGVLGRLRAIADSARRRT